MRAATPSHVRGGEYQRPPVMKSPTRRTQNISPSRLIAPAYNCHQIIYYTMAAPARVVRSTAASLCRSTNVVRSLSRPSPLLRAMPHLQARCYVSESGKKNAAAVNVSVENREIDTQNFIRKTGGLKPSEVSIGGGLTADVKMSPAAGNTRFSSTVHSVWRLLSWVAAISMTIC